MILNISEIVSSVQGEGKYSGFPTTFVRLNKCNLDCVYCDTKYANKGKKKRMSIQTILNCIFKMGNNYICITGGEPLLQESIYILIYELVDRGFKVSIETNGSVAIEESNYLRSFSYCMDVKCPSSGMESKNKLENLENLLAEDEVKFVISDLEDYLFAKGIIKDYPTKASYIFSPVMGEEGNENMAKNLAEWITEDRLPKSRLGVQLHKLIDVY